MPEIKHNFTGGKMNKDLDERLIPNGQYRDAMNIQVSTSEGSEVGTAQNILGNELILNQGFIKNGSYCVGSIADEKNDKLYYFIRNLDKVNVRGEFDVDQIASTGGSGWTLQGAPGSNSGDGWEILNGELIATGADTKYAYIDNLTQLAVGETYVVNYRINSYTAGGVRLHLYDINSVFGWGETRSEVGNYEEQIKIKTGNTGSYVETALFKSYNAPFTGNISDFSVYHDFGSIIVEYDNKTNTITPVFVDREDILQFDKERLITGINVIDDMLFWTDNYSEPKKINIKRSIEGTDPSGLVHTIIINPKQSFGGAPLIEKNIQEEHITVIKKYPKIPPKTNPETSRFEDRNYSGIVTVSDHKNNFNSFIDSTIGEIYDFSFLKVGDYFKINIDTDITGSNEFELEWKNWTPVVIKEFTAGGEVPTVPITNYTIKGKIYDWAGNEFRNLSGPEVTTNGDFTTDPSGPVNNGFWGTGRFDSTWTNTWSGLTEPIGWQWDSLKGAVYATLPLGPNGLPHLTGDISGHKNDAFRQKIKGDPNDPAAGWLIGERYKLEFDILPPEDGSDLQGKLWVTAHNQETHTVPNTIGTWPWNTRIGNTYDNSYTVLHGTGTTPMLAGHYEYDFEIQDNTGYDPNDPKPGLEDRIWEAWIWNQGAKPGCIAFHIKKLGDISKVNIIGITAGTNASIYSDAPNPTKNGTAAPGVIDISSTTFDPVTNPLFTNSLHLWSIRDTGVNKIDFNRWSGPNPPHPTRPSPAVTSIFKTGNTGAGGETEAKFYLWGILQLDLDAGKEYDFEIIISNFGNPTDSHVSSALNPTVLNPGINEKGTLVLNAVDPPSAFTSFSSNSNSGTNTFLMETSTLSYSNAGVWSGLGGVWKGTFTTSNASNLSIAVEEVFEQVQAFGGGTTPVAHLPEMTLEINVSRKEGLNRYFNGGVDNVSVKLVDDVQAKVGIRVDSISGTPPSVLQGETELKYVIDKFDGDEERIFENKFPRFSYRYKYIDGEYSAFSPFTDAVFVPGGFDYHPKKGYNLAMANTLKKLTLDMSSDLPEDVESIDLLYKEENSPNIYIVDTIKDLSNLTYTISGETIKNGLVASNQLLRPWDNVPRKALAQDMVGNRIVYGNYLQSFDLKDSKTNLDFEPKLEVNVTSKRNTTKKGERSIKSLREYQVGVSYVDIYGRETPVLTSGDATVKVNKSDSSEINRMEISLLNEGHPINMKYFKFYIKDTSGEYYNLAMDRFYNAEDDNIWLAFPSVDRNKVEIGDFITLKKGIGNVTRNASNKYSIPNLIHEKAEYKIIDISNEAPDFIKRKETLIMQKQHSASSGSPLFDPGVISSIPSEGDTAFEINIAAVSSLPAGDLPAKFALDQESIDKSDYYIVIGNIDTNFHTDRYKIVAVQDLANTWVFQLEKPFTNEINSFLDDISGDNPSKVVDKTYLYIYRISIDKSSTAKYDGRFFVKIYNDDIFTRSMAQVIDDDHKSYKKILGCDRKIYSLETLADDDYRIKKHYEPNPTLGNPYQAYQIAFYGTTGIIPKSMQNTMVGGTLNIHTGSKSLVGLTEKVCMPGPSYDINDRNWSSYMHTTIKFGALLGTLSNWRNMAVMDKKQVEVTHPILGKSYKWLEFFENSSVAHSNPSTVFMDYDAYFRGFNVDCSDGAIAERKSKIDIHDANASDQTYEDVWFYDDSVSEGNFPMIQQPGGWNEGGFASWPRKSSWESIGYREEWRTFEIGFGGIQPEKWPDGSDGWATDQTFYDFAEHGNVNYSETQANFVKQIAIGSQFRFKEDPAQTIYTITDVNIFLRVRYESLRDYPSIATGIWDESPPSWKEKENDITSGWGKLTPNDLFPIHAKALNGLTGMKKNEFNANFDQGVNFTSNADPTSRIDVKSSGKATEMSIKEGINGTKMVYKTCSYLRPSNFTKNYRITMDKPFKFNPFGDISNLITEQEPIKLKASTGAGGGVGNKDSVGVDHANGGITSQGNTDNKLEVGMVLYKYASTDLTKPAIVSSITLDTGTKYDIKFKTYDGSHDFGQGSAGDLTEIANNDYLYFAYYPTNGLSKNSAKNFNFFRDGVGWSATNANKPTGTDAVGYTMEFVEERSSRSEEEILPDNPAIWETKPKEPTGDIDIYHEASGLMPIYLDLSKESLSSIIPIGSIIEYEENKSIPLNTKVVAIDDQNGQIILSNSIKVGSTLYQATSPGPPLPGF